MSFTERWDNTKMLNTQVSEAQGEERDGDGKKFE